MDFSMDINASSSNRDECVETALEKYKYNTVTELSLMCLFTSNCVPLVCGLQLVTFELIT